MRIDPELASTVAAVIDEGSLEAAARRMRITPSAVSQRLKSLESQLGRVLVVRSRPTRPTAAGEAVVRLARQIALLEHEAVVALGFDAGPGQRTSISLAVNADSLSTWFLPPLARLSDSLGIDFDLHRDDQDFTARLLETGTVMAAVTSESIPVAGCTVTPLGAIEYEPMASPAFFDRWFSDGVTAASLERAPFVDLDRRDDLQHEWLWGWGVADREVPRHYVPASHDFATAVRWGLGWGLLPRMQSAAGVAAGELVRMPGDAVRVAHYWQQWNLRSTVLDAIAAEVIVEARRVLV